MDFIERLFAVSPDCGSGSFEILLMVTAGAVSLSVLWGAVRKSIPLRRERRT